MLCNIWKGSGVVVRENGRALQCSGGLRWLEVLLRRFRLQQPLCWFAWSPTALLLWSRVHHVCAFDIFQS